MQPKWYSDLEMGSAPLPRPMAASATVRVLHGVFRQTPGQYALAMPNHERRQHSVLRVFASTRDELDALIEKVRDAEALQGQIRIHYPRSVPEGYAGPWRTYQRFRIPSRKAERIPGQSVRLKRINEAAAQDLPFFQLASKSNGGRFRLYWTSQPCAAHTPDTHEPHPDSWGLSTTTNLVPIPDIP